MNSNIKTTTNTKKGAFYNFLGDLCSWHFAHRSGIINYCFFTGIMSLAALVATYFVYVVPGYVDQMELGIVILNYIAVAGLASVILIGLFRPFIMIYDALTRNKHK